MSGSVERPSDKWRAFHLHLAEVYRAEGQAISAASLISEQALIVMDEAFRAFETQLASLSSPSDEEVFAVIDDLVLILNEIHKTEHFDTEDRADLCEYIAQAVTAIGVEADALAARHGVCRGELADRTRHW